MNLTRPFLIFLLLSLNISSHAQTPENVIKLPYEMHFKIKGIKTKMILHEIYGGPNGAFIDLTIGFENPQTEQWIFFDAEKVRISNKSGIQAPFELKLFEEHERKDTNFIEEILKHHTGRSFLWKCDCEDSIPKLPI